jgi:hypothetical protein
LNQIVNRNLRWKESYNKIVRAFLLNGKGMITLKVYRNYSRILLTASRYFRIFNLETRKWKILEVTRTLGRLLQRTKCDGFTKEVYTKRIRIQGQVYNFRLCLLLLLYNQILLNHIVLLVTSKMELLS